MIRNANVTDKATKVIWIKYFYENTNSLWKNYILESAGVKNYLDIIQRGEKYLVLHMTNTILHIYNKKCRKVTAQKMLLLFLHQKIGFDKLYSQDLKNLYVQEVLKELKEKKKDTKIFTDTIHNLTNYLIQNGKLFLFCISRHCRKIQEIQ